MRLKAALFLVFLAAVAGGPWAMSAGRPDLAWVFTTVAVLSATGGFWLAGRKDPVAAAALAPASPAWARDKWNDGETAAFANAVLRAMMNLPHAVALVSEKGVIALANERAGRLGLRQGETLSQVADDSLRKAIEHAVVAPAGRDGGPDGVAPPRRHVAPLVDAAGNRLGALVMVQDEGPEALSSFSHALKTPLTAIQMSIYLLLEDAAERLTPRQVELLQTARDDSDRLQRLTEQFLARRAFGP